MTLSTREKYALLVLIFVAAYFTVSRVWMHASMVVKGWEFILVASAILGGIMWMLRKEKPDLVSMMWFAFATMYIFTIGFIAFASDKKWITSNGAIDEKNSGWINEGMHFLLDLNGELHGICFALGAILAVHVIVWFFTCWVGCAPGLSFVARAFDFSTVLFLKGFASFSALMLGVLSYDLYSGWSRLSYEQTLFNVAFAISVFALGFTILWMNIEKKNVTTWLEARTPARIVKIQWWATRHVRHSDGLECQFLSAHSNLALAARKSQAGDDMFKRDMNQLIQLVQETAPNVTPEGDAALDGKPATLSHQKKLDRISEIREKWGIDDICASDSPTTSAALS